MGKPKRIRVVCAVCAVALTSDPWKHYVSDGHIAKADKAGKEPQRIDQPALGL